MIALRACGSKTNAAEPYEFLTLVDIGRTAKIRKRPAKSRFIAVQLDARTARSRREKAPTLSSEGRRGRDDAMTFDRLMCRRGRSNRGTGWDGIKRRQHCPMNRSSDKLHQFTLVVAIKYVVVVMRTGGRGHDGTPFPRPPGNGTI
jgi:hypothetical protein